MTKNEFIRMVNDGAIIECHNMKERYEVLHYLLSNGFEIAHSTRHGLRENDRDDAYLNIGMGDDDEITGWLSSSIRKRSTIKFDDISSNGVLLFDDDILDVLDEKEFSDAFSTLMGGV